MSGTSLDGVDAALCRVDLPDADVPLTEATVEREAFVTDEYEPSFREYVRSICDEATTVEELARARVAVGRRFARAVEGLLETADVAPEGVDLIGSHGQTVWHSPANEPLPADLGRTRATLQVGDPSVIARETGIDTVADFRSADVAAGGHGAPLSPLLDWIQFGRASEDRIVQNIGGIGNCTVLPEGGDWSTVTAFDTGPGNMVIDAVVERLTDGERQFDEDGRMATAGTVDDDLLTDLLDDPYLERAPPKSTGRERYGDGYATRVLERARKDGLAADNVVATVTALTSESIADAYERHVDLDPDRVVVSGGGAYNETVLSRLEDRLSVPVETSGKRGIAPDSREAVLFGLLAALFDADRPGSVPSVTGASDAAVLGTLAKSSAKVDSPGSRHSTDDAADRCSRESRNAGE
ncbi:anhydro-N-acetylmuramic acid kinase [Natronobacterium texcoconense]|uniref:Anhydro-N-acetylmuramic acid kinase n=2 Tax=Natronobacterium texcoconense TaxID=1095778 RepID=A0A1H1FVG5_NATTX|nr:anhydro-N-acetylmuramic acid kinase [Natronobacterium texcoconense]